MGCCCGNNKKKGRLTWIVIAAVVMGVVLLVWLNDAKGQTPAASGVQAITNQTCPVLTDEAVDPAIWVDYQGKRVYFCCNKCKRRFEQDPQAYLTNLPQFASAAAASQNNAGHADEQAGNTQPGQSGLTAEHDEVGSNSVDTASNDQTEHDHDHDHAEAASGFRHLIGWLGKFHPPATDFPVALLISGTLAEALWMMTGRPSFDSAARFCVTLGSLGAVGAVVLGWFFAGFHLTDPDKVMTVHRWLGTGAGVLAVALFVLNIAAHRRDNHGKAWLPWYRVVLVVTALAVATNGFFGGAMIYGLHHYAW